MGVQSGFAKGVCAAGILVVLALAACTKDESREPNVQCGGPPDLQEHKEAIESQLHFQALVPAYLPATTYSVPQPTINLPDDVTIMFPPCPGSASGILGPQVILDETTQAVTLPEPGESVPPTERVQVRGTSVLLMQSDSEGILIGWQQAGLSLSANFIWARSDGLLPEITPEMKAEAIRVVESIIEQGGGTESGQ